VPGWQPDLTQPVNFIGQSYQGTDKKTDLASITSSMKLAWEKIPQDIQPLSAFEIYTFDRSKLEEDFARDLEACQSLGYRITLEVNRDKPNPSGNCSVEWLDSMFKKHPSFVGVKYGVGANGKPGVITADLLKLERVKSLIEVCGKNGAYFILNLWNEGQTTKGVLEKMLADPELVALMKQYHRSLIFFNTSAIRTQVSPEEHVQNTQTLKKMLDDGLIGRMGNFDFNGQNQYDHDWKARQADGYRAFSAPNNAAYWGFLRAFEGQFKGSKVYYLDISGFNFIVFGQLQGEDGASAPIGPTLRTRFGVDHFGFAVDHMEAAVADLKAKGATILGEPWSPRPGLTICYIQGPDAVRIELSERSPTPPGSISSIS